MERTFIWEIPPESEPVTVRQFLRTHGCSRHILTHLKQSGCGILLNGAPVFSNQMLAAKDRLQICVREEVSSPNIVPAAIPLNIVYEDEDLLVLNKQSDLPVHPSVHNYDNTLANGVMHYFTSQGIPFVFRCINRLDRDTSGLLIVAKNMVSGAILSEMSASRQLHREYLAIADGLLPSEGTIDAPIARKEDSVLMRCVDFSRGETAVTHFRRLDVTEKETASGKRTLSLASVKLETGRTHQIRVHMKHIGHPLVGDFLYHPESLSLIGRQALHSYRLSFAHPITGKPLDFTCPMPEDMRSLDLTI